MNCSKRTRQEGEGTQHSACASALVRKHSKTYQLQPANSSAVKVVAVLQHMRMRVGIDTSPSQLYRIPLFCTCTIYALVIANSTYIYSELLQNAASHRHNSNAHH